MKKIFLVISVFLGLTFSKDTLAEVYTTGSATDNSGNFLIIGHCAGSIKIAEQQFNLSSPSAFLLKLSPEGEFLWIRFFTCSASINFNSVSVDNSENSYLTGDFEGTAIFGTQTLTAEDTDFFILKIDSQGNMVWVKKGTTWQRQYGNDITVSDNNNIFICGYTNFGVSFDTLSIGPGGFLLKIDSAGNASSLIKSTENATSINLGENNSILVGGIGNSGAPFYDEYGLIINYDSNNTLLWQRPQYLGSKVKTATNSNSEIYAANSFTTLAQVHLNKYNTLGTLQSHSQFTNSFINDFKSDITTNLMIQGFYKNLSVIGDSTLVSTGLEDAFIAKIDTGFNLIWIKHAGGIYTDEMINLIQLNDGSIITTAHFRGTINLDSFQVSGGTAPDDQWVALIKFDSQGNLIWLKKIGENTISPVTIDWFPTEVGNKWQFYALSFAYPMSYLVRYLKTIAVTGSQTINGNTYYKFDGLLSFPNGSLFRYDPLTQRLLILVSNIEYTVVDFSKVNGESYLQYQPNGSFLNVSAVNSSSVVLGDTIQVRGFYKFGAEVEGIYQFASNIGMVNQDESRVSTYSVTHDFDLTEYILFNPDSIHIKHTFTPSINFDPISFIPSANRLVQNFQITHQYSTKSIGSYYVGLTYLRNSFIQSYYFNNVDTLRNSSVNLSSTSEIDFSLNYQFDTTKYEQGYHFYYRIAAVDKGIVADTFYSPPTGYYKLYWRDSTTSVTQISPEIFDYSLSQNYPNPFNPGTKISFSLPGREFVSLKVFDILGEEIITIVDEELDAGKYEVDFNGKSLSSGIYIYQLRTKGFINSRKMILIK